MKTKNLQPDQKIFFLGLNKNGTTSFSKFFEKNDYICEDSTNWWCYHTKEEFRDREVFTDGYEKKYRNNNDKKIFTCWPNIKFLNETFPNSYYILQTRPMKDWLLSRQLKYVVGDDCKSFDENKILNTIHQDYIIRLYWHEKINFYAHTLFNNTSSQFTIIDISQPNDQIVNKLQNFLKVKFKDNLLLYENKTTWIKSDKIKYFEKLIEKYLNQRKYEI